jgi:glycosyltransferase involved in cell wall biosynthesis
MKLLLVSDQYLAVKDGRVLGSTAFCSNLRKLAIMGELYICIRQGKNIKSYDNDVTDILPPDRITFIRKSFICPSIGTYKKLQAAIEKVDLVVGYVPALNAEVAELIARKKNKKYLAFEVACVWDGLIHQDWKRKIAAPYRFLLNRYVMKHSDYALYVTNEFLQRRYPTDGVSLGLSDVEVLPVSDDILTRRLEKIRKEDHDVIKLATTGHVENGLKGQQYVIKALKILKDMGFRNYEYYLIGEGKADRLRKYAEILGVADQVHFLGRMPHAEVFRLLDDIDIYVHPSLQEGLPRSMVEAMSRALPCIGSNTGGIPELIDASCVFKKKSADTIVDKLINFSVSDLEKQAIRNFNEAKKFEKDSLDARRNEFYLSVKKNIDGVVR